MSLFKDSLLIFVFTQWRVVRSKLSSVAVNYFGIKFDYLGSSATL